MKLGDAVCTTPLLHAIKKHLPKARVIFIGDKVNELVLAGSKDIDEYVVYTDAAHQLLVTRLSGKIDVGIIPGPNARAVAFFAHAGAKMIIAPKVVGGWSPYETKWYRLLRPFVALMPHRFGEYAPREYLRLLEPLGIQETDTTKHLAVTDTARVKMHTAVEGLKRPLVGISASAGNKAKRWSGERFAAVAAHVHARGGTAVIIGGPADQEEVAGMRAHLGSTPVADFSMKTSIEELKALIAEFDLFIALDTGPIYVAEAFDVPTVDIVGPMDEREQPPRGPLNLVVVPPFPRIPQMHIMNARIFDVAEATRQTESITVAQVTEAIDQVLAKNRSSGHEPR
ncbi:MAG: glycosyltransferase family 9 protein [Patescibacteria group bacterium]